MQRRTVLRTIAGAVGIGVLAGCTGREGTGTDSPGGDSTATRQPDPTGASSETSFETERATAGSESERSTTATDDADDADDTDGTDEDETDRPETDASEGHGASWPALAHDAANTGAAFGARGPGTGVEQRWAFDGVKVLTGATVADGSIYVGSGAGVHALDAASGQERWTFETPASVTAQPAVHDGTVYVASSAPREGDLGPVTGPASLHALAAGDGHEVWTSAVEAGENPVSPSIAGGRVYVGTWGDGEALVESGPSTPTPEGQGNGYVHAFGLDAGETVWTTALDNGVGTAPAAADGGVYVGMDTGVYHGLDATSGEMRWTFDAEGGDTNTLAPAVVDGTVYLARRDREGGEILCRTYALDAAEGSEQWAFEMAGANLPGFAGSIAVADGTVYTSCTGSRPPPTTTTEPTPSGTPGGTPEAVASMPVIYREGTLHAIDAATGSERWRYTANGEASTGPSVAGDRIYIGWGRAVTAIDRAGGATQWTYEFDGRVDAPPAIVDGTVFMGRVGEGDLALNAYALGGV